MKYLSVPPARERWREMANAGVGIMRTPAAGISLDCIRAFPFFAADNGCFSQGERFDLNAFYGWLDALQPVADRCLFAVAPDVLGDAGATWDRSRNVLPELRRLGYPAALVAQDGWRSDAVDWATFDVLFVGGTDQFKFSSAAWELIAEARQRGKWVHVGRVNSWSRCRWASVAGADSADGSTVAFNTTRYVPEVIRWAHRLQMRPLWETGHGQISPPDAPLGRTG